MTTHAPALCPPAPTQASVEMADRAERALNAAIRRFRPPSPTWAVLEMKDRFERSLSATLALGARQRSALAKPTLEQAVLEVLTTIGLRPLAHVYERLDDYNRSERHITVLARLGADEVGACAVTPGMERSWASAGNPRGTRRGADTRLADLRTMCRTILLGEGSMQTLLSREPKVDDREWSLLELTVTAWWQARLDEGHTAESAKFLLELLAHPALSQRLDFAADGTPSLGLPEFGRNART